MTRSKAGKGSAKESRERGVAKAGAFCRSSLELPSEVDTRPKERKCLHFLTLGSGPPPPPSPGGPQPQPRRPARSGKGREGTMSGERGMCPQRLFTNTKLFMIAGKRNPTRARSSPDLAGGARAGETQGSRLFPRPAPSEEAVRPGRGAAESARWVRATAAPPLSSKSRGAVASAVLGPGGTPLLKLFPPRRSALSSPALLPPTPFSRPHPGSG